MRLPLTFDTIQPIDIIFGTYYELPLYFQLNVGMWCLTDFYGNHSHMNDVTYGRYPGFLSFQISNLNNKQRIVVPKFLVISLAAKL